MNLAVNHVKYLIVLSTSGGGNSFKRGTPREKKKSAPFGQPPPSPLYIPTWLQITLKGLSMDTIKDRTGPNCSRDNIYGGDYGACPKGSDHDDSLRDLPPPFFLRNVFRPRGIYVCLSTLLGTHGRASGVRGECRGHPSHGRPPSGRPPMHPPAPPLCRT